MENITTFEFLSKTLITYKLFELLEQFMEQTFLIKLTQFDETRSIDKFFIPLGNLKNELTFDTRSRSHFL